MFVLYTPRAFPALAFSVLLPKPKALPIPESAHVELLVPSQLLLGLVSPLLSFPVWVTPA